MKPTRLEIAGVLSKIALGMVSLAASRKPKRPIENPWSMAASSLGKVEAEEIAALPEVPGEPSPSACEVCKP